MKKFISVLLAAIMMFSLVSVAFAAADVTPVIVVTGIGTDQYATDENGERTKVWPPKIDTGSVSAASIFNAFAGMILKKINEDEGKNFDIPESDVDPIETLKGLFLDMSCDTNGQPLKNVSPDLYPYAIGEYPEAFTSKDTNSEKAIARSVADKIGYDNSYYFSYTWSRNPLEIADDLDSYIDSVLEQTGARKATIVACSMGGTITASYLYKYGTSKIKNVIFASSAFTGVEFVGQLFNKEVNISVYDAIEYFKTFLGFDISDILGIVLNKIAEEDDALLDEANDMLKDLIAQYKDVAFSDVFLDTFVTMPGIWALMPYTYYETAKTALFENAEKYNFLEKGANSIDNYMYNVQANIENIIATAKRSGVNVYVVATYLTSGIPVTNATTEWTDNLIETKHEGGYATVAAFGQKLDGTVGTKCANEAHKHLSPDSIVDASTCLLPEQTWFIKNVGHMNYTYNTPLCGLLTTLATSDRAVTVYTYEEYPQFTEYNQITKKLNKEFTEKYDTPTTMDGLILSIINNVIKMLTDYSTTEAGMEDTLVNRLIGVVLNSFGGVISNVLPKLLPIIIKIVG